MHLTVEYSKDKELVEIVCDEEGIDLLIDRLMKLKKHADTGEHDHLMTSSWAGWELTEEKQNEEAKLINHLRLRIKPLQESRK